MGRSGLIWLAAGVALLIVAACFAATQGVLDGAIAATRYSARFSGLVLATALVARARAPAALSSRKAELTLAFVAAHGVHYATVIARAFVEPTNDLRHFALGKLVQVLGGVALLVVVAATAKATSPRGIRTNGVIFYILWALLTAASATRIRTAIPSAVVMTVLLAAMLWRLGSLKSV